MMEPETETNEFAGLESKEKMEQLAAAGEPTKEELKQLAAKQKQLLESANTPEGLQKFGSDLRQLLVDLERMLSFHYIDFLAEFGATELFLVSGDGLLSWALQHKHIDWNCGGQTLPVIWTIERFLSDVQARNGTFRVFFFSDPQAQQAWRGVKGVLRRLLISHLEKNTDVSVDHVKYPWSDSAAWVEYNARYQPAFLLFNLGNVEPTDCDADYLNTVQRGCLANLLETSYILDLEEVSFDGSKVMAFSAHQEDFERVLEPIPKIMQIYTQSFTTSTQAEPQSELTDTNLRSTLLSTALRAFLSQGKATPTQVALAQAFSNYLTVADSLPLSQRSHALPAELVASEALKSLNKFLQGVADEAIPLVTRRLDAATPLSDADRQCLVDFIDARLFAVVAVLESKPQDAERWNRISQGLKLPEPQNLGLSSFRDKIKAQEDKDNSEPISLSLTNSLLDKVIPDLYRARFKDDGKEKDVPVDELTATRLCEDSLKYFEFEKKPEFEGKKWKLMKVAQKQEAALTKYAANLLVDSPAKRVVLAQEDTGIERQRKVRTALESLAEQPVAAQEESKAKKIKGAKAVVKKKDIMIQANKQKKHTQVQTSHNSKLESDTAQLKKLLKDNKHQSSEVQKLVASIEKFAASCFKEEQYSVGVDAMLAVLDYWSYMINKDDGKAEKVIENVFCGLQQILRSAPADSISVPQKTSLIKIAAMTGFSDFVDDLEKYFDSKGNNIKPVKITNKRNVSAIRYQLVNLSYNLRRPRGKAQDQRVSFMPDDWQKKLLDVVDAEESALICAATSSGKTFVSFYAMESILRLDSNSVVVFVAPTKALVAQMEAEVSARFSKTYRNTGKYLCGTFLREYKRNLDTCQVLITIPACLETLMMNPSKLGWTKTIKYVILDEVHCLGQENGEVWQRLLLTISCPFLALSATIGNLDQLYAWMSGISESKGRKMHLVHHKERYNYLKMSYVDQKGVNQVLNPLFALNFKAIRQDKQLPDIKLLPEDCIQAIEILKDVKTAAKELPSLEPEKFFSHLKEEKTWNISMKDASTYEDAIKQLFLKCLLEEPAETEKALQKRDPGMVTHTCSEEEDVFKVLEDLKAKELLPCIVFHLSRAGCEALALSLADKLATAEMQYRKQKGTQANIDKLGEAIEKESGTAKRYRDIIEQCNSEGKKPPADVEDRYKNLQDMQNKYNLLTKVDKQYAFLPRNVSVTMDDIKEHWKWADPQDPLVRALLRGIGFHHGGVDKNYRKAVERMFRLKQLAIVFGTATLSLGLNMPCKCVVMCRDSIYINGVQFRQMAGRAGRRGFDLEGRVILAGLPASKIKRLLANRLPDIISSSPLTPTSSLRLLVSHAITRDEAVVNVAKTFVAHPLFFNRANNQAGLPKGLVTGSHFLLGTEYLLREGVVDASGMPNEFGALAYHLYWMEPQNFWLVALLRSGLFDALTARVMKDVDPQLRLTEVLANVLCKIPLHKSQLQASGPSAVVLPPLPKDFKDHLRQHEERLKGYARDFAAWFVKQYEKEIGEDNRMPMSSVELKPQVAKPDALSTKVASLSGAPAHFSNFATVSGFSVTDITLTEICGTIRSGVALDRATLPGMDLDTINYNAYIVDFVRHGDRAALLLHNKIRSEALWESLREFGLILQVLTTESARRIDVVGKNVAQAQATAALFQSLSVRYKAAFDGTNWAAGAAAAIGN